ncbi:MAG TPA: hypothetical protein VHZ24_06810 [Pirellulales bacterium]|jgi:hypothetical protein|nr:hypothetical protein [Pirellulales bacterium]
MTQQQTKPITVVLGPPGSGKTTFVANSRSPGDVVWDFDVMLAALTGSLSGRTGADGFNGCDVQQTAPSGGFGQIVPAVGTGNVKPVAQQQGHFGMANLVNVAAGHTNPEGIERPAGQQLFQDGGTHTTSVPPIAGDLQNKLRRCRRCGSCDTIDVPIHDGQSLRRDCARCNRFIDFPLWYGVPRPSAT